MDPDVDEIIADRRARDADRIRALTGRFQPALDRLADQEQEDMITGTLPPLPPFGEECCPKCDGDETTTVWVTAPVSGMMGLAANPLYTRWIKNRTDPTVNYPADWLVQTCKVCGYVWDELPLDHAAALADEAE